MRQYLVAAAALFGVASASPHAHAQSVAGNVTVSVYNGFGRTVGTTLVQCTTCTYSPAPPGSIATGTTGASSTSIPNTQASYDQTTVRYGVYVSGNEYECQFKAVNLVKNGTGSCGTPTIAAVATDGVYPSSTCTRSMPSTPDSHCNSSIGFQMTQ